jgi:autotransporter-associated beta strand protein
MKMDKKTILKINSAVSVRPVAWLSLAVLGFVCSSSAFAGEWLAQDYSTYTVGDQVSTNNTPSLLTSVPSNNVIVNVTNNLKLQYFKAASASGGGTLYKLSDNLSTDRPQGYFSFKATVGTTVTGTSYLSYVLGANDSNSMSAAASTYLQIRLYNATPTANQLRIYSGSGTAANPTQVYPASGYLTLPAGQNSFQVWYNKTASGMTYTNPAGVSNQVSSNAFVVYINGTLYGSNAASTGPLPTSVSTSSSTTTNAGVVTTNWVTSSTIGKLGWQPGSSTQPYDVTFDNVYAADSAPVELAAPPVINSANSSTGYQNVPYSYQITADQPITSYALTGNLPAGLSFESATGKIIGTPTELGTTSNISITATSANGTSAPVKLTITISLAINTFSGSNASLSSGSWSLGASPNSSSSSGSYQDLTLASSVTDLFTTSSALWGRSWNVVNGSSYNLTSAKTDGSSAFKMGITSPTTPTFANSVSGVNNDLVYLANSSSLTFSPLNSANPLTPSTIELSNSGNLNIGLGSTLNINAVTTGSYSLTKTGVGTVGLSAGNTYSGGTILRAGTVNVSGSQVPTRLAQVKANVTGGAVTSYTVIDGGAGYTAVPTVTIARNTGEGTVVTATATAEISNGAVTAVTVVVPGSGYTLAPKVQIQSNQSPLGTGAVTLSGGTLNASVDTDLSRMSFYPDPTNTFFRINGNDTTINGSVTLNVDAGKTLSSYTIVSDANTANMITKTGGGTLWLRGGGSTGAAAFAGGFQVNAGTLSVSVSANAGTGTGTITMNGGNLVLSKGIGSAGIYSGLDMANTISVLADTTITLDPNPLTPTESNLASAALLQSKASKTITVAKSSTANDGAQMVFKSAELQGTTTFNVADATQVALGGGTSSGGVTKTGLGTLVLSVLDSTTSAIVNNTYTGATAINAGTVSFYPGGSQASSISVADNAVAQFSLGDATPTTSGSLTLSSGSKVRISGTPINGTSYTLFTAAGGIIGTPTLATPISLYSLKKSTDGNSLILEFAKITPTITVTPGTYTYSGSMQGPGVDEVSKGGSQGLITLSYAGTGGTTYSSSTPPTNAGNYTVTATVSADATYSQASSAATAFTIAKATPTVSAAPTASAVTAGALLSSSNLSGGTASVPGTFAWTTPSTVVNSTASYPVTFTPNDGVNYNTASSTASVTANPAGTTYSTWLSGNGGTASDTAFLNYVFGAVTAGSLDASLKPTVAVTGGNLVLTYNVRQGTVGLTVMAQTSADLATGAAGWGTSGVTDVAVGAPRTVNGVSVQQRTASVSASGGKKFLKVKAEQAP